MSRDLEKQLNEMGPEYRAVALRLCAAREVESLCQSSGSRQSSRSSGTSTALKSAYLVAASLLVVLGLSAIFIQSNNRTIEQSSNPQFGPREYRASVSEMIATQNPDGSWQNDFLTRRNAEALKLCGDPAAQVAYRKAVRNLRVRGVL